MLGGIFLLVSLRCIFITADPPKDLSASGGYFADEGYWTHNARNKILFDEWSLDEWNNMYVSPILHVLTYLSFFFGGVSLQTARLVPVILSITLVLLLSLVMYREKSQSGGLFLLLFLGLQYPFAIYNRIAIVETPAAFFLCLVIFFLSFRSSVSMLCGGISLAFAYMTKTTVFFAVPAVLFLFLIELYSGCRRRELVRDIIYFAGGFIVPMVCWYFFIHLPSASLTAGYNEYYRGMLLPSTFWETVKAVLTQRFHVFFNRTPLLLLLSHLSLFFLFFEIKDRRRVPSRLEILSSLFYVSGILFFALFLYRPLRYYVVLMAPMTIMSVFFLLRLSQEGFAWMGAILKGKRTVLFILWISYPLLTNGMLLVDRFVFDFHLLGSFFQTWPVVGLWYPGMFVIVLLSLCMGFGIIMAVRHKGGSLFLLIRQHLLVLFFVVFISVQLCQWYPWISEPHYVVRSINEELGRLPLKGAFTGQWAGELCLETNHRVIPVFKGFVNDSDPFERYQITYFLLWEEYGHKDSFFTDYPLIAARLILRKTFRVKDSNVYFFEMVDVSS